MAGKSYGPSYGSDQGRYVKPARPERDDFRIFLRGLADDVERVKDDLGEPFVVELPSEPHAASQRLLAALGVEWIVTETNAAEVGRSYDCQTPHCTNQARSRVGRYSYCDECRARRDEQQKRTGVPASLAERLPPREPAAATASSAAKVSAESSAARLKELLKLGHQVDRAIGVAKQKADAALQAKADAEVLQRRFRALGRDLFGDDA